MSAILDTLAESIAEALRARGETVAVAESSSAVPRPTIWAAA